MQNHGSPSNHDEYKDELDELRRQVNENKREENTIVPSFKGPELTRWFVILLWVAMQLYLTVNYVKRSEMEAEVRRILERVEKLETELVRYERADQESKHNIEMQLNELRIYQKNGASSHSP